MKKTTLPIFLATIVFIGCMHSCKNHTECPAFNEAALSLLPYSTGDTLSFFNQDSAVFQIFIKETQTSPAYSYDCQDLYGICVCTSYVELYADDTKQNSDFTLIRMEHNDRNRANIFYYKLLDLSFEFDFENDPPHLQYFENIELIGTHVIGETAYPQVLRLTDSGEESSSISYIYFNKPNGILQFKIRETGEIWKYAGEGK